MSQLFTVDINLKYIKSEIKNNPTLSSQVASCGHSVDEIRATLVEWFADRLDDPFRVSIDDFITEHLLLINDPGIYLTNASGNSVMKISQDMIFRPPPTHREDGTIVQQAAMVHPGVTSGLALIAQEKAWIKAIEDKYGTSLTDHLKNPWKIVKMASAILIENGMSASEVENKIVENRVIEVGHENVSGIFQAANPSFRRIPIFATSVVSQIMALQAKNFYFVHVEQRRDSMERWYDVTFQVW